MPEFNELDQRRPKDLRELAYKLSPGFLRGYWGQRLVGAIAGVFSDTMIEGAFQAITARSLRARGFPTDGLDLIGEERMLPRFPGESHDNYKSRLLDAWRIWQQSGTEGAIKMLFSLLGFTVTVITNTEWNWDDDVFNVKWSRFWVVFDDHTWTTDGIWDDPGTWDDGGVWDTNATLDEVRAVRNIVRTHKAVHEICPAICVVFDPVTWAAEQPDGHWTYPWRRSLAATYWDG